MPTQQNIGPQSVSEDVIPADLISGDADNALVEGTDDKLFVPPGGGGVTLETPTPDPDDVEDTFTGSAPPKMVFRNGVMELRLGTVVGNTFVFDTPPSTGDDIEFVV